MSRYTIRPYEMEDMVWVVEVASYRSITEEAKRPDLVNKERWYQIAKVICDSGIGFIALDGEKRVGMIGGLVSGNLFNPEMVKTTVITWYVLPEYRSTRVPSLLLKNMEEEARIAGKGLTFSLFSSTKIKDSTLEKKGYLLTEMSYTKEWE